MELPGVIQKIIFRNEESGWSVLSCKARGGEFTVTGVTPAQVGQRIVAFGDYCKDKQGREQFKAEAITIELPGTEKGIERYLSSGVFPGIGANTAKKLITFFGTGFFEMLDTEPERLFEIQGIEHKKLHRLADSWQSQKSINEIVLFLSTHGIPLRLTERIHEAFGKESIAVLTKNPYELATRIKGVGFKTADRIAQSLGVDQSDSERVRAGVLYCITQAISNGSTGQDFKSLKEAAQLLLELPVANISETIQAMLNEEVPRIEMHDLVVYDAKLSHTEEDVADLILSKLGKDSNLTKDVERFIQEAEDETGFELASKQKDAVRMSLTKTVSILTGGPGVGKTATLEIIISIYQKLGLSIALLAPTGKAAQRASQATGLNAETLHRAMKLESDNSEPKALEADVVVVDEVGMMCLVLSGHFCNAVTMNTIVLFVGDYDQLLSVGPGSFLRDLIHSGSVPYTVLDQVFRQAEGSLIIKNAHNINKGIPLVNGTSSEDDFWIITEKNYPLFVRAQESGEIAASVAQYVSHLVSKRIPEKRGFDIRDIWVLTPTNKGECGVDELNKLIQAAVNPSPSKKVARNGVTFGVGDRIMQMHNNYDVDLFNGDIGYIKSVDHGECSLSVLFEGKDDEHSIPFENLGEIKLAYAMTIHRSQGSQSKVVIIPLIMQHSILLQRNTLYTGTTRASELAVVIGESKAIDLAISRNDGAKRLTRLKKLMMDD